MGWLELPVRSRPRPSALFILDPDGGLFRPHLSTSSIPQWGTVHTPPQASSGRLSAHHDARTEERVVQLGEVPKRRNEAGRSYETPLPAFSWGAPARGSPAGPGLQPIAREALRGSCAGRGRVGFTPHSRFVLASPLLPWACTSGSNKLKLAHDNAGGAEATGLAVAVTSSWRSQQPCWRAGLSEHVCGKAGRLSVVCIFMFHVQQHFPGDLAKPALAESRKDSCSLLPRALPASRLRKRWPSCLGRVAGLASVNREGHSEDPHQGVPAMGTPARSSGCGERERVWTGLAAVTGGMLLWPFPPPQHPCREGTAALSPTGAATTPPQASFPTVQRRQPGRGPGRLVPPLEVE